MKEKPLSSQPDDGPGEPFNNNMRTFNILSNTYCSLK